jgi:acid stress chaperone HdeB
MGRRARAPPLIQIKSNIYPLRTESASRAPGLSRAKTWEHQLRRISSRLGIILLLAMLTPATSIAEDKMVVDMSKLTCGELTKVGFEDFAGLTMWLSGYYNAGQRNTVIDLEEFARAAKTVKDYCGKNRRATVMSAAERALGITMPR